MLLLMSLFFLAIMSVNDYSATTACFLTIPLQISDFAWNADRWLLCG